MTTADVNKTVEIKNGIMKVDNAIRTVEWEDAKPADCTGRIVSVELSVNGTVRLDTGAEFLNPRRRITFTIEDLGKTVVIKNNTATIDGVAWAIKAGAKVHDCEGKIVSIESNGTVKLHNDHQNSDCVFQKFYMCRNLHLKFINAHLESGP